jgi:flagellar hook-associated protein 2
MESIASVQGLATGIDFRDLIDQIVAAESRPVRVMETRQLTLDSKEAAWTDFQRRIRTLDDRADALGRGTVFDSFRTSVTGGADTLSASARTGASPGTYNVDVLAVATREKVGSDVFASLDEALGFSGTFVVGGRGVEVSADDTLRDIAGAINAVNAGASASRVTASLVGSSTAGYRMVLTADTSGESGVRLADGSSGLLQSLGYLDGEVAIRHQTSDGATSDAFSSSTIAVATQLGLVSTPPAGTVGVGSLSVGLDLAVDGLEDIADAINAAAASAGSPIEAQIVSETGSDGRTARRLDVSGTTSFTDASGVLETLGILESGRSAVAQQLRGVAFTDADGVSPATAGTLITDFWQDGTSSGVQVGDTLSISGMRGDGTTFAFSFDVGATGTYQDLVDALNSEVDGLGAGTRTAIAAIADGAIVITDDTGGYSRLALTIVSNNEGGGGLDFGTFDVTTVGRDREITAGRDAQIQVDGVFYGRSSNTVDDVIPGVTLSLTQPSESSAVVSVEHDVDAIVSEIEGLFEAMNGITEFVSRQFSGAGATEGGARPPLSGEGLIRSMRGRLRGALESALAMTQTQFGTLSELGIEINRRGTYDIDAAALRDAVESDPIGVRRMFSSYGSGSVSSVRYVSASAATEPGTYDVVITGPATRAEATGTGFGGTYVDDGVPDQMTITDYGTGSSYSAVLADGMSLAEIVEALNDELGTATRRELRAAAVLRSDASGTEAVGATALADLHDDTGTNLGVADGDVLTIAGARADGTSFFREWTVSNAATQTLSDLRAQISAAVGFDVEIDIAGGTLTATAAEAGRGDFTLSVSSDNAGGGSLTLGAFDVAVEGRGASRIVAMDVGGQLSLRHEDYGSAEGFSISYTPSGTDGTGTLGLAAGAYAGDDVSGTIGGEAATGVGQLLTGGEGSAADGLSLTYRGSGEGAVGSVTYSRGIGSSLEGVTDGLLSGDSGSIQAIVEGLDTQKRRIDDRIEAFESRLDLRAQNLMKRFSALEEAMAKAQQQAAWLQAQLGSLLGSPTA